MLIRYILPLFILCLSSSLFSQWTEVGADRLFYNGPVAIGSNDFADPSQGFLLSVDGRIACEEVLIQLSEDWADYVFEPGYRLLPLDELATFIEENHRLPNMPTATEVEKEGLELAKATGRLLEKVEELMLYLIEDEKTDKKIEARLSEIERN